MFGLTLEFREASVSKRVLFDINLKSQTTCPESPTMATHAVILYPSRILNCIVRLIADWLMGKEEEVQHGSLHDSGFLITPRAYQTLVNNPQYRGTAIRSVVEAMGSRMESFYCAFGDYDV